MSQADTTIAAWREANYSYLVGELERLRLLLKRRVLWLRTQWAQDAGNGNRAFAITDGHAERLLAAGGRQAERRFFLQDPQAVAIGRSIAELGDELVSRRRELTNSGRPAALDLLSRLYDLSEFERNLLILCLAPELDPSFSTLFAYIQDDATRKYPCGELAMSLFLQHDEEWPGARARLTAGARLRRFLLLEPEPGSWSGAPELSHPLRISPRATEYMLGINHLSAECGELVEEIRPSLLPAALEHLAVRLREWLASREGDDSLPIVNLIGPVGSGRRALARFLCERMGLRVYELKLARLPTAAGERQRALRVLEREATLLQCALFLDASEAGRTAEADARAAIAELVESLTVFLLVSSTERLQTARNAVGLHTRRLTSGEQHELWQRGLAADGNRADVTLEVLVQQFDLGPEAIAQALATATTQASLWADGDEPQVTVPDLWRACRELAGWRLDDLAQRIVPCHSWEDIVLPADVVRQLREIASQVANRGQVYEEWGFGAKLQRGRGISALFAGPSGTGKTLAAEILAHHLDLDLYRIDLSGVVSKYIGETEKNLRKVFDVAEQSGAILFFDEADALFGKRSEVRDSHDRYANIEVNYLLQRMEDYRGLAILATNMKAHLDPAFLRRLRFLVDFPFPDAQHRAGIWRRMLPETAPTERLDFASLSRLEVSGGNIRSIALNAAFLAAENGGPIKMEHLVHATRREYSKLEKLMHGTEFHDVASSLRLTQTR